MPLSLVNRWIIVLPKQKNIGKSSISVVHDIVCDNVFTHPFPFLRYTLLQYHP